MSRDRRDRRLAAVGVTTGGRW